MPSTTPTPMHNAHANDDPEAMRTRWDRFHPIERRMLSYECAWSSLQAERNDDSIDRLRTEHRDRVNYWSKRIGMRCELIGPNRRGFVLPPKPSWRLELVSLALLLTWAVLGGLFLRYNLFLLFVVGGLGFAALSYFLFRTHHRRDKLHNNPPWQVRTLINPACPNCNYDLSNSPDAIPPDKLDGWCTGPRQCSECGVLWPLVPSGDIERQLRDTRADSKAHGV